MIFSMNCEELERRIKKTGDAPEMLWARLRDLRELDDKAREKYLANLTKVQK